MYLYLLNIEAFGKQPKIYLHPSAGHQSRTISRTGISTCNGKPIHLNMQVVLIIFTASMFVLPAWSMQVWRSMSK